MLHNLPLARRHAVAILTSMALALTGLPAGAQSSSVGSFAEAAARAAATAGAGFTRRSSLQQMYNGTAVRPFWTANGRPTRQAMAVIGILGDVATRGLDARNYASAELATMAGTLDGRTGSFALQHSGTMVNNNFTLIIVVVPGSGTGELAGIDGKMNILIAADGKHSYDFEYTLPAK